MTATAVQAAPLSFASAGCSSDLLFPAFSNAQQVEFSIAVPVSAPSFDWSDFPVVYQYNEDMPVPQSSSVPLHYFPTTAPLSTSSSASSGCSSVPTPSWDLNDDDDDTTSFSFSSDEEETASACDSTESNSSSKSKRNGSKKSVKFSEVLEIRSHPVVLGNHPCSSGLALELGWEIDDLEVVDFDLYESSRQFQRRHMGELRLSYWERRRLLEASTGLSEQELLLQEQRVWRDQQWPSESKNTSKDKAPALPQKSCSCESHEIGVPCLRKVTSSKTLATLSA